MKQIQPLLKPVNSAPSFSEKEPGSDEDDLALHASLFQGLLRSMLEPQTEKAMTDDFTFERELATETAVAEESTGNDVNFRWLHHLLNRKQRTDGNNLMQINGSKDQQQTKTIDVDNIAQLQNELLSGETSGSIDLQAITDQALVLLQTLMETASGTGHSSGDAVKQMMSVPDDAKILQTAEKLLELLKQYEQFQQVPHSKQSALQQSASKVDTSTPEATIWNRLLSTYNKRNHLTSQHHYNAEASTSTKDVAKWVKQTLTQIAENGKGGDNPVFPQLRINTGAISQVEQFVIHAKQDTGKQLPDKALLEQFQKVIQSSQFTGMKDGFTRLNFTLRPENLGDMTVKLAQVNGDMTVKITVGSAAVQDMMEKNIHQLKHMFSPHQVIIERQDTPSTQTQTVYSGQEDGQQEQEDNENPDLTGDEEQLETEGDGFQEELNALLNGNGR